VEYDTAKLAPVVERLDWTSPARQGVGHAPEPVGYAGPIAVLKDMWTLRLTQESRANSHEHTPTRLAQISARWACPGRGDAFSCRWPPTLRATRRPDGANGAGNPGHRSR